MLHKIAMHPNRDKTCKTIFNNLKCLLYIQATAVHRNINNKSRV